MKFDTAWDDAIMAERAERLKEKAEKKQKDVEEFDTKLTHLLAWAPDLFCLPQCDKEYRAYIRLMGHLYDAQAELNKIRGIE